MPAPTGAVPAVTASDGIAACGDSGSISAANVVRKAAPSTEQVLLGDSAAASSSAMTETPPDDNVEWRGLIEICTSPDSVLGRKSRFQKGCRVTRITREVDFTKPQGVDLACDSIFGPHDVVWISLPCIGGCPRQYVSATKGPEDVRRLNGHWALHGVMWKNVLKVLAVASEKGHCDAGPCVWVLVICI